MNERHLVDTVVCVHPSQCMCRNLPEYWWHTQPGVRVAYLNAIRIREGKAFEFVYIYIGCVGAAKLTFHLCKCVRIRTLPNATRSMCACNARTCACFVLWIKIWGSENCYKMKSQHTYTLCYQCRIAKIVMCLKATFRLRHSVHLTLCNGCDDNVNARYVWEGKQD